MASKLCYSETYSLLIDTCIKDPAQSTFSTPSRPLPVSSARLTGLCTGSPTGNLLWPTAWSLSLLWKVPINHALNCINHDQCANDWRAVWWNGMSRFLLYGRNPQSWDDAVARFRTLQYGSMADSCRERVMGVVIRRQGFSHADALLNDITDCLADSLIREGPTGIMFLFLSINYVERSRFL
jgi:hypothetical protein